MSKFSGPNATTKPKAPAKAPTKMKKATALTHEGGAGYVKGDKTALFTLAVTNMVGEPTFYESASNRDGRFEALIHKVAVKDPAWIAGFVPFLRDECNMRSASVVVAVEAARAILTARAKDAKAAPGVSIRGLIASACSRADEPAEVLGYWLAKYGRPVPPSIRRGIADAAVRLYNERSLIKYDGGDRGVRFADVIDLCRPSPGAEWQSDLFRHALDRRHGNDVEVPERLQMLAITRGIDAVPEGDRRALLAKRGPALLDGSAYTWERLSGWLPGGMDAAAWEAVIPKMGYMALLRNLRNFEQAGVSRSVLRQVAERLADADEVAKSRQFPYRFWSAYKNSGTAFFAGALEEALEHSLKNIPVFSGRTLVAIDTSGSMNVPVGGARSKVLRFEVGALFAAAVASQSKCDVIEYADGAARHFSYGNSRGWGFHAPGVSVLRSIEATRGRLNNYGYGTDTWGSVRAAIAQSGPYDRVIVFTDQQNHRGTASAPTDVLIYVWDLAGYATSSIGNTPGHYLFGGFTDQAFKMIGLLEAGIDATWPWES